jgi:hypothetical protein
MSDADYNKLILHATHLRLIIMFNDVFRCFTVFSLVVLGFNSTDIFAGDYSKSHENESSAYAITPLKWTDKRQMQQQVNTIDTLARSQLGSQIHNNKHDLDILQHLIYKGSIAKTDSLTLQALGVVLGNVMASEFDLEWKIYEDSKGRSRALCSAMADECLFPITMLSRRIEVGLLPNVKEIYTQSYKIIQPYLEKQSPYTVNP